MDFASHILQPKFSANKPTIDGYEVTNLVYSGNGSSKSGFICEGFVRPPADITIEFPISIDISRIELCTEIGCRRSKGITVLAKFPIGSCHQSSLSATSSLENKKNSQGNSLGLTCHNVSKEENFVCLGKWFTEKDSNIILKNYNYKHRLHFPIPPVDKNIKYYIGALRHPLRDSICHIKAMIVRIINVTPTGPPVLQSIRIWGQPSLNSCLIERRNFVEKWLSSRKLLDPSFQKDKLEITSSSLKSYDQICIEKKQPLYDNIPDDFLDSLTYEIMTVPLLLPSGNSVDMHSLEKFICNEAIWGRSPSDPFTGVPFKDGYKPEPNVPLKARIDRFLLLNGHSSACTVGIGYTVGSSVDKHSYTNNRKRTGVLEKELGSTAKKVKEHCSKESNSSSVASTCLVGDNIETDTSKLTSSIFKFVTNLPPKVPVESSTFAKTTSNVRGRHSLVRSLGNAGFLSSKSIQQKGSLVTLKGTSSNTIIGTRPNVINSLPANSFVLESIMQGTSSCPCGQKEVLYLLNCDHILCRLCLTSRPHLPFSAIQCGQCSKITQKHQVKRFHQGSLFEQ